MERVAPLLDMPPNNVMPQTPFPLVARLGIGHGQHPAMTLGDLLVGTDAAAALSAEAAALEVSGLSADSRAIEPGFVFFAIAGAKQDGGRFVPQALQRGAVAIVADQPVEAAQAVVVVVPNPRAALAQAAARFFPAQPATVVAVTGTSGKTSVTAFVRQIWTALGHRAASLGTIGVVAPGRGRSMAR